MASTTLIIPAGLLTRGQGKAPEAANASSASCAAAHGASD
jgi:hypothetical protein